MAGGNHSQVAESSLIPLSQDLVSRSIGAGRGDACGVGVLDGSGSVGSVGPEESAAGRSGVHALDPKPETSDSEKDKDGDDDDDDDKDDEDDDDDDQLCTYQKGNIFSKQHWYHCNTCEMEDEGYCSVCIKICHRNHDVVYANYSSFSCHCGVSSHQVSCLADGKEESSGESENVKTDPVSVSPV